MVTKFLNIADGSNTLSNSNMLVASQKAVRNFVASKSIQLNFLQATAPTTFVTNDIWLNTTDCKTYTATSDSTWGAGVSVEKDQFFTYNDLLYYFNGSSIVAYSTLSITEQNHNKQIKLWAGTRQEYDELDSDEIDPDTKYWITDEGSTSAVLATQTQFDNSSSTTASTPYQVNQKFGNYLAKSGGNLDAEAILRLTNANNEVSELAYNISGYLTISSSLYTTYETNTNSLVVRSGNVYKVNTTGPTVLWTDSNIASSQLPVATDSSLGAVKIDGTTISINNGVISASGSGQLANTASGTDSLTILGNIATNNYAVNIGKDSTAGTNSTALGDNAYALTNSVAIGSAENSTNRTEANATGAVAVGYNAKATANNAVQLGAGTNSTANTVQIGSNQILDANGKVPSTRIPVATSNTVGGIMIEYDSATNTLNIKTS